MRVAEPERIAGNTGPCLGYIAWVGVRRCAQVRVGVQREGVEGTGR